jgi:hypothetical protein
MARDVGRKPPNEPSALVGVKGCKSSQTAQRGIENTEELEIAIGHPYDDQSLRREH